MMLFQSNSTMSAFSEQHKRKSSSTSTNRNEIAKCK